VDFALIVHPYEASSTVGTAWILRRSISNIQWIRSKGIGLDEDPEFLNALATPNTVPLVLFPGPQALNLSQAPEQDWRTLVPPGKRPVIYVLDGTWTLAHAMLRKSAVLRALPRVSFDTVAPSEYTFKTQPHPHCLSTVEGVHRILEIFSSRGWGTLPPLREHDQMIEIFRNMIRFQLEQERNPRFDSRMKKKRRSVE
jgi:DTW domain-containing protein YfiP